jgi:hypothetical protein
MIRVETRSARTPAFDDRATLQAVNRYLPVPSFTVEPINASAAAITTAALTITVVDDGGAPPDACASPRAGFDVSNPRRSPAYPNGLNDTTQATCCAACNSDAFCTAFVFNSAPGARGNNCWPLSGYSALVPAADRLTGGASGGASVTVRFKGPSGNAVTWTPGAGDPANLNGTYSRLLLYPHGVQHRVLRPHGRRVAVHRGVGGARRHAHRAPGGRAQQPRGAALLVGPGRHAAPRRVLPRAPAAGL